MQGIPLTTDIITVYLVISFIAIGVMGILGVYGWTRRSELNTTTIFAAMLLVIAIILSNNFALLARTPEISEFWHRGTRFASYALFPPLLLVVVSRLLNLQILRTQWSVASLFVAPVIIHIVNFTNGTHQLFTRSYEFMKVGPYLARVSWTPGPWFFINIAYSYLLLAVVFGLLIRSLTRVSRSVRLTIWFIIISILIPSIAFTIDTFQIAYHVSLPLIPLSFAIVSPFAILSVLRFRVVNLTPRANRRLFEEMSDPVLVLDETDSLVDANPPARDLIPQKWGIARLKPLDSVLPGLASKNNLLSSKSYRYEVSLDKNGSARHYDVQSSPLVSSQGQHAGRLMVLRDITSRKQIERQLLESEQFSRAVLDGLSPHIAIVADDGEIVAVNQMWRDFAERMGAAPEKVNMGANYLAVCDKAAADGVESAVEAATGIRRVLSGEADSFETEYQYSIPNARHWFRLNVTPFGTDDAQMVVVSHEDITVRARAREAERGQRELADALSNITVALSRSLNLSKVLEQILETLHDFVPFDTASILLVEDGVARIAHGKGYETRGAQKMIENLRFPVKAVHNLQEMSKLREPLTIPNVPEDDNWVVLPTQEWIGSYAGAPIFVGEVLVGYLNVESETTHFFTEEHLSRLGLFADQSALALRNARLYEDARQNAVQELTQRRALHQIVESLPNLVLRLKVDTVTAFSCPPHYRRFVSLSDDDIGRHYQYILPSSLVALLEDALTAAGETQTTTQSEHRLEDNGDVTYFRVKVTPILATGETLVLIDDMTQLKTVQQAEYEQRVMAEALRDVALTLNRSLDLDDVLSQILSTIGQVIPHDFAAVLTVENGMGRIMRTTSDSAPAQLKEAMDFEFPVAAIPEVWQELKLGQSVLINDIDSMMRGTKMPVMAARSVIATPFHITDDMMGVIALLSKQLGFFDTSMLESLQIFGEQAGSAFRNARLYQQAQDLAILEERQRIARDLHDAVSQTLFSASITSELLLKIWHTDPDRVKESLGDLVSLTRGAQAEMRSLLMELRPQAMKETSLAELLHTQLVAFGAQTGIVTQQELIKTDLSFPVKQAFYRVAQEALNNITKHAGASEVTLRLRENQPGLTLEISDNGVGFDTTNAKPGRLGLGIMQERADSIAATLTVNSAPTEGTTVTLQWDGQQNGVK